MRKPTGKRRAFWRLLKLTTLKWQDDNIAWLSAALAYYTLFSLAPTFIILVAIGGRIFGEEAVRGQIVFYLEDMIGTESALFVQNMVEAGQSLATLSFGNVVGIAIILYAATNVFFQLKNTFNELWEVPTTEKHWVVRLLLNRFFSILMVFSIGVVLMGTVLADVILAVFGEVMQEFIPLISNFYFWKFLNSVVSLILNTFLFAAIFKLLPDTKIRWSDVWLGAFLTSLLFSIGKLLIALYLGNSQIISLFGAASSFVAILVWVYFSSQLLLIGAAFTHYYTYEIGSRVDEPYREKSRVQN